MVQKCVKCKKAVRKNQQAISCNKCDQFTHRVCGTGYSKSQYAQASKGEKVLDFHCIVCQPSDTSSKQTTSIPTQLSSSDVESLPDLPTPEEAPFVSDQSTDPSPPQKRRKAVRKRVLRQSKTETTEARVARLRAQRIDGLKVLIAQLDDDKKMELLVGITERQPALIFDVCDKLAIPARDTPVFTPPVSTTNPDWCTCGNCQEMSTDREKLCCRLLPQNCLSLRPEIDQYCLDEGVLQIAIQTRNDIFFRGSDDDEQKKFCHAAYRQFIYWRHGRLGKDNRQVIPSCIVCKVRRKYPDPNGQYTGFKADKWA